ncbi:uncharacterized protein GLRG_06541 [Colletotrichum graminicola M1.001]|uniref:Uncharacterized protein n=1 Tax=Colletotrichum graminicola (strain M1.001 / M2 / FGSC 10212) TaxID=645133 RepID=E3QKK9_COLGM|nr:uncharacterized protein GLRG_06541 [Colletotrichum graminicola M1.001]EFQ31397.1 hypothetical protein GLRG_06541 [Colletotrichum graminicola M1.001]
MTEHSSPFPQGAFDGIGISYHLWIKTVGSEPHVTPGRPNRGNIGMNMPRPLAM